MIAKFETFDEILEYLNLSYEHFKGIRVIAELYLEEYAFNLKIVSDISIVSEKRLLVYFGSLKGSSSSTFFYRDLEDFDYFQVSQLGKKIQISFNWNENYIVIEF